MGCGSSTKSAGSSYAQISDDKETGSVAKAEASKATESPPVKNGVTEATDRSALPSEAPALAAPAPKAEATDRRKPAEGVQAKADSNLPPLVIWEHIRDAVTLWGSRGGGVCQAQPLFDAISALLTVDEEAQQLCGIYQASVHMGSNAKVAHTLVPLIETGEISNIGEPGKVTISARTAADEIGLKDRLEQFLMGEVRIQDPELLNAIHVQDVDWADVDNGAAVLSLANTLQKSGAKHILHAFVSERRFTSEFSPCVVHRDEQGVPIKAEVMTDADGQAVMGLQFRVHTGPDLSNYQVKPSIMPYIKELDFEYQVHNKEDMSDLARFECAVLKTQLRRAGLGDTVVGRSEIFEKAGLSGNVHKLTWYLYDHDGNMRSAEDYRKDAEDYFNCGIGNSKARRDVFKKYVDTQQGLLKDAPPPADFETFFAYCRKHPDDKIVIHCGGPLFLVRALARQADLRSRVILIGAMFLAYDGEANLLGMNFNEGVAPVLTEDIFGYDGKHIHTSFPNARLLCVTTETCKCPSLCIVPFQDTVKKQPAKRASLYSSAPDLHIPGKSRNQPLLIISDDGRDPDDELAKVLLKTLTRRGLAICLGFISNLQPAKERARLSKGTLNELGMGDLPVGIGQDMIPPTSSTTYEFSAPYMAGIDEVEADGVAMFVRILNEVEEGVMVTLVCLSGLSDAWLLLDNHRELFLSRIGRVVIIGGVETEGDDVKLDADGCMMPDQAQNNTFDMDASRKFYKSVQEESIPLTIVTRWAAYAARLPFTVYDNMAETEHPVGVRLRTCQRQSIEHLWHRACMEVDDPKREGLPARCDKTWFCKVFLGGQGQDRTGADFIWDLASTFNAYDPLALLAALHGVRARFMRPLMVDVLGRNGMCGHEVIGMNESNNSIVDGLELGEFLHSALVKGLMSRN